MTFTVPITLTTIREAISWTSQPQEKALQLSSERQLAFCLTCCERLESNWRTLARFDLSLDAEFYRTILDRLWQFPLMTPALLLQQESILREIIADVTQAMEAIQPKTDGSHSFWYQLDYTALSLLYYIADDVLQNQRDHMVKLASSYGVELVYDFVVAVAHDFPYDGRTEYGSSMWEWNTPIVQQEVHLQMSTIDYLQNLKQLDEAEVKVLKTFGFAGIQAAKRGLIM